MELLNGLHIPLYGDVNFVRKVINTKRGNMVDPVDLYVEQLSIFATSR